MKRVIGQIINGKFVDGRPVEAKNREQPLHREFIRNEGREKFARDIVQPYKRGEVNPEYIEAFGKQEASKQFGIRGERDE